MFRYIAFHSRNRTGDHSEEIYKAIREITNNCGEVWTKAYCENGFEVWHSGQRARQMETITLPDNGVILGRVLSKTSGYPDWTPISLTDAANSLNPTDLSDWLAANVWGNYVAFLPQGTGNHLAVFRDPMGVLPCYRVKWGTFNVFTSNIELLKRLPSLKLTPNFDRMCTHILLPLVCKDSTCLDGAIKVLPGECLHIREREHRTFHWDPLTISRDSAALSTEDAAIAMRDTLMKVVAALARPYRSVLHSLGGLDSSIILSSLSSNTQNRKITCVNLFTDSFAGDERHFARTMAAHTGVPLIERKVRPEMVDLEVWRQQEMGAAPPMMFDGVTQAGNIRGIAANIGADAISSGVLGDGILFESPYIFPALDYVADRGAIRGLLRVAMEAAQNSGQSLLRTATQMVGERLRPKPCYDTLIGYLDLSASKYFIGRKLPLELKAPKHIHPMLRPDKAFPKGKYYQILGSSFPDLESLRHRFPDQDDVDGIYPMVAQPFVELCLKIPTWHLIDGGLGRGLARKAFWNDLPREILGRTSKATEHGMFTHLFSFNTNELRDTLLDGVLAREGFLDREKLEHALNDSRDMSSVTDTAILFDMFGWEVWASRWAR